ncbi:MAG: transposase [Gammaproteobacteria bacterium]|nr:transposase [Gammaproteobacteria bacterium]
MVAADARTAVAFALSRGNAHDAPQGRQLLKQLDRPFKPSGLGHGAPVKTMKPVGRHPVPASCPWCLPKAAVSLPGRCGRELYGRRNEVDRLFRKLKGFRRIFSRFDRLDVMFLGFVVFALVIDALCSVNKP